MRAYWIAAVIAAASVGAFTLKHQDRPFSAQEVVAKWEGHGPDPGRAEYTAALEAHERRAQVRQASAPLDAALAFVVALGVAAHSALDGIVGHCVRRFALAHLNLLSPSSVPGTRTTAVGGRPTTCW